MYEVTRKQCTKCQQWHPATTVYFHRDNGRKDKLFPHCKECRVSKDYIEKQQRKKQGEKRCSTCRNFFPATLDFFYANSFREDGLTYQCKSCALKVAKENDHKPERREKRHAYDRARYRLPEVRERRRAYNQAYHRSHYNIPEWRERHQARNKLNYLRRREQRLAYYKGWRKRKGLYHPIVPLSPLERKQRHYASVKRYLSTPKGYAVSRISKINRRARERATPGSSTAVQIQDLLKRQHYRCYYCGQKFAKANGKYIYHIEHTFPLSRVVGTDIPANDISYLVLACPICNDRKGDKFPWEFPEGGRLL